MQVEVGKVDTAKFDDAYFKAADKKKGASKKTEGEFFNEVRSGSEFFRRTVAADPYIPHGSA